ncbi:competence/damage-inducible protein A [Palleronia caenipelagi]|uniref:Competence/damage-inducible protein A n=1 Tax=Palleronia caenipelagi TaxID=2489174 RepID=A0A547Q6Q9_9RHOB|nr:molybdopterin-binding protein [Palleronia caenipelagi]TRD22069.1 competence/damage-inducible protein A [Palleronia caenipelagi]
MTNPTAAMLVIGDEILSGRTRDSNAHHLAKALTERGIELCEIRVVSDKPDAITGAARDLSGRYTHLFTSGGIGPTHDDITADCIAAVFDTPIGVRDDARAILQAHYAARDAELNEARLRMARIPDGAELIDNPISSAPGFSLRNIHVMAGVPQIFEAMLAGLLPRLAGGAPVLSRTLRVSRGEGDIAAPLAALAAEFPDLSVGSYPSWTGTGHQVAIVLRGTDGTLLEQAVARLRQDFPEAAE